MWEGRDMGVYESILSTWDSLGVVKVAIGLVHFPRVQKMQSPFPKKYEALGDSEEARLLQSHDDHTHHQLLQRSMDNNIAQGRIQ
jgi:hypothetical protein